MPSAIARKHNPKDLHSFFPLVEVSCWALMIRKFNWKKKKKTSANTPRLEVKEQTKLKHFRFNNVSD